MPVQTAESAVVLMGRTAYSFCVTGLACVSNQTLIGCRASLPWVQRHDPCLPDHFNRYIGSPWGIGLVRADQKRAPMAVGAVSLVCPLDGRRSGGFHDDRGNARENRTWRMPIRYERFSPRTKHGVNISHLYTTQKFQGGWTGRQKRGNCHSNLPRGNLPRDRAQLCQLSIPVRKKVAVVATGPRGEREVKSPDFPFDSL